MLNQGKSGNKEDGLSSKIVIGNSFLEASTLFKLLKGKYLFYCLRSLPLWPFLFSSIPEQRPIPVRISKCTDTNYDISNQRCAVNNNLVKVPIFEPTLLTTEHTVQQSNVTTTSSGYKKPRLSRIKIAHLNIRSLKSREHFIQINE